MKKWLIGIFVLCSFITIPAFLLVEYRMVENPARKRQAITISEAGRQDFPEFQWGWSPGWGAVFVRVSGATASDPSKQTAVREWLGDFKARNGLDASVRLEFYDAGQSTLLAGFDD
ncbi:MAG: hypothetical protein K2R98_10330 [Gemmataceae bacterium]|nr:hypothetical protein [Gemmataceae bacterium]